MKRILEFKVFETLNGLTEEQKFWLDKCTSGSWSVGIDGRVDVDGDFNCSYEGLYDFKGVRFGRVSGDFICRNNKLDSLEGAPEEVGGDFYCRINTIKSLVGSPKTIGGDFICSSNQIDSLDGAPETVGGDFYCSYNYLKNLVGSPREIRGVFSCTRNNLKSLVGAPEKVGSDFFCKSNSLETLEGSPKEVGGDFYCDENPLESLEGAPKTIGGEFRSGSFRILPGEWGFPSWIKVLEEGSYESKRLISTLISPEALNKRLSTNPEETMVALKGVWNSPAFAKTRSQLRIPRGYEDEMDLLGDLDDIGL
jgi:hypothetical protein